VFYSQLEWLVALPWNPPADDNELTKPGFLARARAQLDADHFGLDKVKRRLIEHLAVVRLRQLGGVPPSPPPPSARAAAETGTQAADVPTAVPDAPAAKRTRAVKGPILL
jgi:ATP-dependent Lon protease